jgi:hypothetical protein
MKDIRVVKAKVLLKVRSIAPVRGFWPPAIIIIGDKFNYANEIQFNGIQVSEFLIASTTRIVARIPNSQIGKELVELLVLAPVQSVQTDALVTFGMTKPIRALAGIDRLVQNFLLTFFTTPGSDLFDKTAGGGGRALIGQNVGTSDRMNAVASLTLAVDRTKQELLRKQAKNSKIPPSEKLLSATLTDVKFDPQATTLYGVVSLRNMVGDLSSVTVK